VPRSHDGCREDPQRHQEVDEEEEDQHAEDEATLGNVASGLAEQLSSITEEMNKIRQELYGEGGIGGIAKELDKLKAGGLGSLLDGAGLESLGGSGLGSGGSLGSLAGFSGGLGGTSSSSSSSSGGANGRSLGSSGISPAATTTAAATVASAPALERLRPSEAWDLGDSAASSSAAAAISKERGECAGALNASDSSNGGGAQTQARRRRTPEERDRELEELRRKLMARSATKPSQGSAAKADAAVSMWEKLVLLFLVLVCLYVGSPFFRSSVKKALSAILFGEVAEGWEAESEDGEIEPDY